LNIVVGTLSIICWVIVGWPQMYKNYKDKSGEALSVSFLVIWLTGDIFNIAAAIIDPTFVTSVLLIGIWYLIMDVILVFQIYYYRGKGSKLVTESTPLKPDTPSKHASVSLSHSISRVHSLSVAISNAPLMGSPRTYMRSPRPSVSLNARRYSSMKRQLPAICLSLCAVGSVGYLNFPNFGEDTSTATFATSRVLHATVESGMHTREILVQVLGWICTVFYVGSRLPQIIKNFRRQSCEGLSIWMFVFAVLGNLLFSTSLFVISVERAYIAEKAWAIVGSLGTLVFDFLIFCQYFWYGENDEDKGSPVMELP